MPVPFRMNSRFISSRIRLLASVLAFLVLSAAPGTAAFENEEASGDYALDKSHATLLWKVNHLGFSDYVGRFNSFDATLTFDPEFPTGSKLDVVIDAKSLDVNNPEFAEKLRGEEWFNTKAHPEIRFRSTKIKQTSTNTGKVTGNLTFMGVTKPVTLDVKLTGQGRDLVSGLYKVGFEAAGTLDRTEFGLDHLTMVAGKQVTLEIHAEFTKQ